MKYNICYNKQDFYTAIRYVNAENPGYKWDESTLMSFIKSGALENVKHLESGIGNWIPRRVSRRKVIRLLMLRF
jgi:hypothetical protein